jgi:hypothetical protein
MVDRIRNSWELVKASAGVLQADKELIVFPIVSSLALLLVTATFAIPFLLSSLFDSIIAGQSQFVGYIVLFVFYLVQYFVIIFSNTALVGAAMIRLEGGDPTLADGFQIAWARVGNIFGYSLLSATVGMILRILSERDGFLSRIAASIFGLAWSLATFLVVPVLVIENVGPIEAVKRSGSLLRETWGEQIVGNFSISVISTLITVVVVFLNVVFVIAALAADLFAIAILVVALSVIGLIILNLITSTLTGIYTAAVYRYAAGNASGDFFPEDLVTNAFRRR